MMTRPRSLLLLLAAAFLLAGCAGPKSVSGAWPAATSEPSVVQPAGAPRWPLTGLTAPSADAIRVRIVSVKIENSDAARPQTGLDQADVVYETITEGGITRFNALFQSKTPKTVGPVRSARPSDFYIVPQYHALFAHCGGDAQVRKVLTDPTRFDNMDQFFNPGPYRRASDRLAPHNLYLDIAKLRTAAVKRGYAAALDVQGLTFVRASAETTPSVTLITIPFSSSNRVTWRYSVSSRTYARSINGKPHTDRVSGKVYTARNVVVLWARTTRYAAGKNPALHEVELTGSGRASVFRDGQRTDGTWEAAANKPPVLRSSDGKVIGLEPGNTWFQVIGNDQNISMK